MSNKLTEHGRKALERCIREHQNFIRLAVDYDLDEMSVQALRTGIESMQMRLDANAKPAAGPSEHDESWAEMMEHDYDTAVRGPVISNPEGAAAYCRELSELHSRVLTEADNMLALAIKAAKAAHAQPVTPAGGEVVERRFVGVGELERTGYIPAGSAAEREARPPVADVVDRVHISNPHDLDPITAYLEDHGGGKGRLTIACYGDAWTGYWGAMGCGLREFLAGCDPSYVTGNLLGLRKSTIRERAYVADIAKELIAALNQRGGG